MVVHDPFRLLNLIYRPDKFVLSGANNFLTSSSPTLEFNKPVIDVPSRFINWHCDFLFIFLVTCWIHLMWTDNLRQSMLMAGGPMNGSDNKHTTWKIY